MNTVYFSNIVKNSDGSYNFFQEEKDVNGNVVLSGEQENIWLDANKTVSEALKTRVADNLNVVIQGEDEHTGEAGFNGDTQAVATEELKDIEAPVEPLTEGEVVVANPDTEVVAKEEIV